MKIEVEKIANLANLKLSSEEVARFSVQFENILKMVDEIKEASSETVITDSERPAVNLPDLRQDTSRSHQAVAKLKQDYQSPAVFG